MSNTFCTVVVAALATGMLLANVAPIAAAPIGKAVGSTTLQLLAPTPKEPLQLSAGTRLRRAEEEEADGSCGKYTEDNYPHGGTDLKNMCEDKKQWRTRQTVADCLNTWAVFVRTKEKRCVSKVDTLTGVKDKAVNEYTDYAGLVGANTLYAGPNAEAAQQKKQNFFQKVASAFSSLKGSRRPQAVGGQVNTVSVTAGGGAAAAFDAASAVDQAITQYLLATEAKLPSAATVPKGKANKVLTSGGKFSKLSGETGANSEMAKAFTVEKNLRAAGLTRSRRQEDSAPLEIELFFEGPLSANGAAAVATRMNGGELTVEIAGVEYAATAEASSVPAELLSTADSESNTAVIAAAVVGFLVVLGVVGAVVFTRKAESTGAPAQSDAKTNANSGETKKVDVDVKLPAVVLGEPKLETAL